ncbi:uncharacterized protein PV07_04159 [Cladophialophora immunda]|uniref:Major facilitator superfamily (MFS) profile domain-containing protein n=1 Tax=Cladophialophora immunda TaxID=569365 RepID=A0A0D2CN18_9EURO|nr:uncharacterized protein PV07_04159 [Cladophialophora immunda]KIW32628.1 hypothetical protein PV07_04159 [Cladophialophora immunda]
MGEYVETKSTLQILKDTITNPKVLFCSLMYFGTAVTGSSSSFFLPSILEQLGWTSLKAQYMSILIWLVGWAFSIVNGFVSDKVQRRWLFFCVPLCFSVIGYALLIAQSHIAVSIRYMALFFAVGDCFAAIALSLTWMNNNILGSKKRGIVSAAILALGNCGSVLGSNIYLSFEAPGYLTGFSVSLSAIIPAQVSAIV